MRISPLPNLSASDFPKEQQKWLPLLLTPLNQFLQSVTTALQNNLDFSNNFLGQVQNVSFTFASNTLPIKFQLKMNAAPSALSVVAATENNTPVVLLPAWKLLNGTVYLTDISLVKSGSISALASGSAYTMQVRLET